MSEKIYHKPYLRHYSLFRQGFSKPTHQIKIWFIGGVLLIVMNIWQPMASVWLVNSLIIISLIIIPIVYSYRRYQTLTNRNKG